MNTYVFRVQDHNNSEEDTWQEAARLMLAEVQAGNRVFMQQNFGRWNRLWAIVVEVDTDEPGGLTQDELRGILGV